MAKRIRDRNINYNIGYRYMYRNAFDKYNIIKPYLEKESSLSFIADKNNINLRTLQRWVERYKQKSLWGLNRKKRSDSGKYRKIGLIGTKEQKAQ